MQKKGQAANGVGMFITLFITIIVGVILMIAVAQSVGETLDTATYDTDTGSDAYTMPVNGASIDLEGQEYISGFVLKNATGGTIHGGNYTVSEIVSTSTGVKTISLQADTAEYDGLSVNATYVYGPDGYVEDSGARGIIGIIVVMFALAIAVIAMEPTIRSGIINGIGK